MKCALLRALPCALALALLLGGCAPAAPAANSTPATSAAYSGLSRRGNWWSHQQKKYTQADYDLALSFMTEGYEQQSVADFDRQVLDWNDEAAYHPREDALRRLLDTLPDDDPNSEFILRTLGATWRECEKKHYNACQQSQNPWHSGWAQYETYGDIFGDQAVLTGAYLDFEFDYSISDEQALTVGQRDEFFRGLEAALAEFLAQQPLQALADEDAMEKILTDQLKGLLQNSQDGVQWGGQLELSYWWDQSWEDETSQQPGADEEDDWPTNYTQAHLDQALAALKPHGYETMPVAQFDRQVHAALQNDEERSLDMALNALLEFLPESDPNYAFFHTVVLTGLREYEARAREVYSRKQVDPEFYGEACVEVRQDVFGDQVVTGMAMAGYTFTYRLVKPEELTVQQRDQFLQAVTQGAQEFLENAMAQGAQMDEAAFRAGLEAAGKAASTGTVQFTGCELEYFEFN